MTTHLTEQQIELIRRRQLSPVELPSVDEHIAECETCRARIVEEEKLQAGFKALHEDLRKAIAEPNHCSYEQIEAYVGGMLDESDREAVESHLALCLQCQREVDDLVTFKKTVDRKE